MNSDSINQTMLDQMVGSDRGQLRKAMIPYLPPKSQQLLSIYEKASELQNTIALFSGAQRQSEMHMASVQSQDPLEIIGELQKFCYGNSKKQLDWAANLIAMAEMFQIMNEPSGKGE